MRMHTCTHRHTRAHADTHAYTHAPSHTHNPHSHHRHHTTLTTCTPYHIHTQTTLRVDPESWQNSGGSLSSQRHVDHVDPVAEDLLPSHPPTCTCTSTSPHTLHYTHYCTHKTHQHLSHIHSPSLSFHSHPHSLFPTPSGAIAGVQVAPMGYHDELVDAECAEECASGGFDTDGEEADEERGRRNRKKK